MGGLYDALSTTEARTAAEVAERAGTETDLPMYTHLLPDWIEAVPDFHARLSGPNAHVADIACGVGHSTRAIAAAYPHARVPATRHSPAAMTW